MICDLVKWNLGHFVEGRGGEMEGIIPKHSVKPIQRQKNTGIYKEGLGLG